MELVYLGLGLAGLVFGGDMLVRGASDLARRAGLPPLVIGLTLVGFGTSMPELVTSLQAASLGSPGIAIGNVVGSNIANILLILGAAAILAPIAIDKTAFRRDGLVLALSTLLCAVMIAYGQLTSLFGAVFILALLAYLVFTVWSGLRAPQTAGDVSVSAPLDPVRIPVWRAIAFFIGGLALTILGARFFVTGAISVAQMLGVSEAVIGLTVVAVGTSLPELVTTLAAARRKQVDIAFGNIVGSNIFNVLFILGATALVTPIEVPRSIQSFDVWVMCAVTALLLIVSVTRWRISRLEGGLFLLAYAAYIGWLAINA
ncbi:calcium/sodium antiporter [Oceanicaulis sp.]|uniref:calcium/sodium antiporter n=1 Tax=Oceanicaulis sp. TaxID=1924941 RepID=UPI003BAD3F03